MEIAGILRNILKYSAKKIILEVEQLNLIKGYPKYLLKRTKLRILIIVKAVGLWALRFIVERETAQIVN